MNKKTLTFLKMIGITNNHSLEKNISSFLQKNTHNIIYKEATLFFLNETELIKQENISSVSDMILTFDGTTLTSIDKAYYFGSKENKNANTHISIEFSNEFNSNNNNNNNNNGNNNNG